MKRNFYIDDFEEFLQQKTDQYNMYPSDRVWNNIDNSIRGNRKKWFLLGLLFFLLGTGALVTNEILSSQYRKLVTELNQNVPIGEPYFFNHEPSAKSNNNTSNASSNMFVYSVITVNNPIGNKVVNGRTPVSFSNAAIARNFQTIDNIDVIALAETNSYLEIPVDLTVKMPAINDATTVAIEAKRNTNKLSTAEVKKQEGKTEEAPRFSWQDLLARETAYKLHGRWSLIMYVSPIVSYRKLSNNNKSTQNSPVAVNLSDNIDGYVNHKPAVGFELGSKIQYNRSQNLTVQAGLQLNYSRYSIDAYTYNSNAEKAMPTLGGASGSDTITSYTSIRNFEEYNREYLQNQYLQISAPIGAEMVVLGKRRLQLNVAASIQPSYLVGNNSYLISADYKKYVQKPDLVRKWNLHTNLEAFVSYKAHGLRWQVGPQFRHQTLSSYSDQYPIREYITEFGFKFGVSKTLR